MKQLALLIIALVAVPESFQASNQNPAGVIAVPIEQGSYARSMALECPAGYSYFKEKRCGKACGKARGRTL